MNIKQTFLGLKRLLFYCALTSKPYLCKKLFQKWMMTFVKDPFLQNLPTFTYFQFGLLETRVVVNFLSWIDDAKCAFKLDFSEYRKSSIRSRSCIILNHKFPRLVLEVFQNIISRVIFFISTSP